MLLLIFTVLFVLFSTFVQGAHPFEERNKSGFIPTDLINEDVSLPKIELESYMDDFFYSFNISIGNPKQNVPVIFNTGSHDLVVNSQLSRLCESEQCLMGSYAAWESLSEQYLNDNLTSTYQLSTAEGSWVKDTVSFGGAAIKNFPIGLMNSSNTTLNFFGMGLTPNPFGWSPSKNTLWAMSSAGAIKSSSMSVRLAEPGSVLFGGVDTSQYIGELVSMDIAAKSLGKLDQLAVDMTSLSFGNGADVVTYESSAPIKIETGTFDLKLPHDFVQSIVGKLNITSVQVSAYSYGTLPCDMAVDSSFALSIGFAGLNVTIPMGSLIYNATDAVIESFGLGSPKLPEGTCLFAINPPPTYDGTALLLGSAFMKYVYFVVDLDSAEIAMANVNLEPGAPNIHEIPAGPTGLASLASPAPLPTATPPSSGQQAVSPGLVASLFGTVAATACIFILW